MLLDPRSFPLTAAHLTRIRGSRPAGPALRPAAELLRVERRLSCRGPIMVAKQRIHVGIQHARKTATVEVDDSTFTVQHGPDICWWSAPRRTNIRAVAGVRSYSSVIPSSGVITSSPPAR